VPLLTIKSNAEGKGLPSFASPTPANSTVLAARFTLRLDDPDPVATYCQMAAQYGSRFGGSESKSNYKLQCLLGLELPCV
jgi:hypothetical protein